MPVVGLGHTGLWVDDLEQSVAAVNAEAERLLHDGGPAYQPVTWTPVADAAQQGADAAQE